MAKWSYSYRFGQGGGVLSPLTEEGPPHKPLTIEADTPLEAATKAKELLPGHLAQYSSPFGWTEDEVDSILIMITEPDEDAMEKLVAAGNPFGALALMMPTIVNYKTMEISTFNGTMPL